MALFAVCVCPFPVAEEGLAAELHAYFWLTCKELTARWKEAMLRLPPSVLREQASRLRVVEAVTDQANLELKAAYLAAAGGRESAEHLRSRDRLYGASQRSRRGDDPTARRTAEGVGPRPCTRYHRHP
jgi:hypothetical protein